MPVTVPPGMQTRLDAAGTDGLDIAWVCEIQFGSPVGTRYYATRPLTIGANTYVHKLLKPPPVPKQMDSTLRSDALNDQVSLRFINAYEDQKGAVDAERLQDLMHQAGLVGTVVKLGTVEKRSLASASDIKWDGLYRVAGVDYDEKYLAATCIDAMFKPGTKKIGVPISDGDWPQAPAESYGQIRGPIFGKVEGLAVVPVEVGLEATLDSEIDDQSGIIYLVPSVDLTLWPSSGYVMIDDEIVRYVTIDKINNVLGSASSPCTRGAGFPNTTVVAHLVGAVVREIFTGKESTLAGTESAGALSALLVDASSFPSTGTVVIENEAQNYSAKSGNFLQSMTRGVPVPTIKKVHNGGTSVRLIPTGTNGQPRYRYVVAEGAVSGVTNVRVVDQDGKEQSYSGGAGTVSQVTTASGRTVSVLDLPARPRLDRYEGGGNTIPQDWMAAYDPFQPQVIINGAGYIAPNSFYRWRPGPGMSSNLTNQFSLAIDPNTSSQAAILKTSVNDHRFNALFDAHWDNGLNNPRVLYGRFKDARLRVRYQFDRSTSLTPTITVLKDTVGKAARQLHGPNNGAGTLAQQVGGGTEVPQTRWSDQYTTRTLRLKSTTGSVVDSGGSYGGWIYPWDLTKANGVAPKHQFVLDPDQRSYLCGDWSQPFTAPNPSTGESNGYPGHQTRDFGFNENLTLLSTDALPNNNLDQIANFKVTLANPNPAVFFNNSDTGSRNTGIAGCTLEAWSGPNATGTRRVIVNNITLSQFINSPQTTTHAAPAGLTWADCQSVRLIVPQLTGGVGTLIAYAQIDIEYRAAIEGQSTASPIPGSSFFLLDANGNAPSGSVPSEIMTQEIALGSVAKLWAKATGNDPWDFFSQPAPQGSRGGLEIDIEAGQSGDPTLTAIGDIVLELEYYPPQTVYDGTVVVDVDRGLETPYGGGAAAVLQHPVDLMSMLVSSTEFYNLGGFQDATTWAAAKSNATVSKLKISRAITETIELRDLLSSLASECLLMPLFDAGAIYLKVRTAAPTVAESVMTIGDQADPAKKLSKGGVAIANRDSEYFNSIDFYYRRNLRINEFRTVLSVADRPAQSGPLGFSGTTVNLEWHQSARGYANGFSDQKAAVQLVANYGLAMSSTLWDYATFTVSGAVGERLQRYDVVTLNRPVSGLFSALGRVMRTERRDTENSYAVTLQLLPSGNGPYWFVNESMKVTITSGGSRMEWSIQGLRVMVLTSAGDLLVRNGITNNFPSGLVVPSTLAANLGTPALASLSFNSSAHTGIAVWRWRGDGANAGKYEHLLQLRNGSTISMNNYSASGTDAGVARNIRTAAALPLVLGANGIVDTGSAASTGELQFLVGGKMVARITNTEFAINGNIVQDANL